MLIQRDIEKELKELMSQYPVVSLTGPRQSGKTTLAKMTFPDYNYCNLENPDVREIAENDPRAFFKIYRQPLIIDEVQRVPKLLSYIQVIVDEHKKKGRFLLTGSHQLSLREAISQSLAGRTALLKLYPFSLKELIKADIKLERDEQIAKGFLPPVYDNDLDPYKAYRNYFQTYVERDVLQLMKIRNLSNFENFVRLLAGRVGQVLNLNSLSNNLGVSVPTLSQWISVLEASFIIVRIWPYYENFGKRIIKSPKLYFSDTGLVCYLLGIENSSQVARDPLLGGLFENMVVMEAVKTRTNLGHDPNLYFYRDNVGNEIDLLYQRQRSLIPVEIKAAMTFNDNFLKGITFFNKINPSSEKGFLIYAGELEFENDIAEILNFRNTFNVFG